MTSRVRRADYEDPVDDGRPMIGVTMPPKAMYGVTMPPSGSFRQDEADDQPLLLGSKAHKYVEIDPEDEEEDDGRPQITVTMPPKPCIVQEIEEEEEEEEEMMGTTPQISVTMLPKPVNSQEEEVIEEELEEDPQNSSHRPEDEPKSSPPKRPRLSTNHEENEEDNDEDEDDQIWDVITIPKKPPVEKPKKKAFASSLHFTCAPCGFFAISQQDYLKHISKEEHKNKMIAQGLPLKSAHVSTDEVKDHTYCSLCDLNCLTPGQLKQHLKGKAHKKNHERMRILEVKGKGPNDIIMQNGAVVGISNSITPYRGGAQKTGKKKQAQKRRLEAEEATQAEAKEAPDVPKFPLDELDEEAPPKKNPLYCELCMIMCSSTMSMIQHKRGNTHRVNMMLGPSKKWRILAADRADAQIAATGLVTAKNEQSAHWGLYCEVCDLRLSGKASYDSHMKGNRHKKNLKKKEGEPATSSDYGAPDYTEINACLAEEHAQQTTNILLVSTDTAKGFADKYDLSEKMLKNEPIMKPDRRLHSSRFKYTGV